MAIDYSGLISEGGRAALSSIKNMPPDQQRAKMNDMLANGLLPFSVAMAVDKQLREPLKENAPSPRPGSVMEEKLNLLNQMQGGGIDQLPAPDMQQAQFAGGGIVAFDGGGDTSKPDPFAGLAGMAATDKRYPYMQWLHQIYDKSNVEPDREAELKRIDDQQKAGKYGKYSEALANYGEILKGREKGIDEAGDERKARRAGWLAMAQAGAEGKGLLAGATAGLAKHSEVSDAREEKRKTELQNLQKEQYTLQLGLEQARASGDQQAETAYLAGLERNAKAQEMLGRGLGGLYEMDSKERIAALDRSAARDKDFNVDAYYGRIDSQLHAQKNQLIEAGKSTTDVDDKITRNTDAWTAANKASRYGVVQQQRNEGALDVATRKSYDSKFASLDSRITAKNNNVRDLIKEKKYDEVQAAVEALAGLQEERQALYRQMMGEMDRNRSSSSSGYGEPPPADTGTQPTGTGSNPQVPRLPAPPTPLPSGA